MRNRSECAILKTPVVLKARIQALDAVVWDNDNGDTSDSVDPFCDYCTGIPLHSLCGDELWRSNFEHTILLSILSPASTGFRSIDLWLRGMQHKQLLLSLFSIQLYRCMWSLLFRQVWLLQALFSSGHSWKWECKKLITFGKSATKQKVHIYRQSDNISNVLW